MGGSSKSVTVGYKYYVGMHMVLCRGPVDYLKEALVDDKTALFGNLTSGTYGILKDDLFGGESREGGVSGLFDVMNGESTQTVNSYLSSKLGSLVPAFRGVLSVVLRQMYLGINPYLKKWSFLAQRIHVRQNGIEQWYDAKSEILAYNINVNYDNSIWRYLVVDNSSIGQPVEYAAPSYDDSSWPEGQGGFGYIPSAGLNINTNIAPAIARAIWLRKIIEVPYGYTGDVTVSVYHDDYGFLWWNGEAIPITNTSGVFLSTVTIPSEKILQTNTIVLQVIDSVPYGSPTNILAGLSLNFSSSFWSDMNPAHIIRECLTDPDWGMGYAEADIDDVSFKYAADTLYEENMGMSLLWDTQISIEEFVQLVCKHINALIYVDRKTGLFVLKLIRQDYDEENLLILNPSNVSQVQDFTRVQFGELVNSITVSYWDSIIRDVSTLTVTDIALASTQGATINTSVKYDGFTNANIASRVAQRDLKALSTPLISCTVYANTDAANLNIGDCFKLSWPDYDIEEVIMRVATIGYGDGKSNRVRLTCTQDVFAMPDIAYIAPTPPEGVPTNDPPVPVLQRLAFELPYLEAVQQLGQSVVDSNLATQPDISYFAIAAGRPSSNSLNARLYTDAGGGYQEQTTLDFCPFAKLSANIDEIEDSFAIEDVQDASEIQLGSWFQIGTEIMEVVTILSGTITVKRGLLDTVPTKHTAGDTLFFWDLYGTEDSTQYVIGETVSGKLATVTGAGVLPLSSAPVDSVTMVGRLIKPYPPGKLQINSNYFPSTINGTDSLSLTWAHRDRRQQTGADYVGFLENSIGPEVGTTYNIRIYGEANTLGRTYTGISGTSQIYDIETEKTDFAIPYELDGDVYWNSVISMLHLDSSANDTVSGAIWTVETGTPVYQSAVSKIGSGALQLNGSSSIWRGSAPSSNFAFGTQNFTIEGWVYRTVNATEEIIICLRNLSGSAQGCMVSFQTGGVLAFSIDNVWRNAGTVPLNTWTHFAFCRNGSNFLTFLNGTLTNTYSTSENFAGSRYFIIGRADGSIKNPFTGYLDEIRVTKGICRYTSNFTPLLVPYPDGLSQTYRANGKLRFELESQRDGNISFQKYSISVERKGYGFNYGKRYGE